MVNPIPEPVRKIWETWNIRGIVQFSLLLQSLLIFLCPYRKSTRRISVTAITWSAYLLADWAATFGVGLIFDHQGKKSEQNLTEKGDLVALWAPFLLLHLGGPDTITAFSLEDNELWIRHFLSLVAQATATFYVFLQFLPNNKLLVPNVLLITAGIIKYMERNRALYLASMDSIRNSMRKKPDPGPDYSKFMEVYASKVKNSSIPADVVTVRIPDREKRAAEVVIGNMQDKDLKVLQYAYYYFNIFKGLLVNRSYSSAERNQIRKVFDPVVAEDALRILEVELSFFYEVLHTKAEVVHSLAGCFFRFAAFVSISAAFVLFHLTDKDGFDKVDVKMTYALFVGSVSLEVVAFLMFVLSDWTFVLVIPDGHTRNSLLVMVKQCVSSFLSRTNVFQLKKLQWKDARPPARHDQVLATSVLCRRWSESISTHNLVRYCLGVRPNHNVSGSVRPLPRKNLRLPSVIRKMVKNINSIPSKVINKLGIEDILDEIRYVGEEPLGKSLWEFIFSEVKTKSEFANNNPETAEEIYSARGDWIVSRSSEIAFETKSSLERYLSDVTFDESLLMWHIATTICYYHTEVVSNLDTKKQQEDSGFNVFSKILSDYMLYLFVMRPTVMLSVQGNGRQRFEDTCAEAKRFFNGRVLGENDLIKEACDEILSVETSIEPQHVKGDASKSVLFNACDLAKKLNKLGICKWEVVSKVWVEMLSHAAIGCQATVHAQQLSKGGELIAFVWLLMAHFGLGEQFQINERGTLSAKVVVRR